MTARTSDSTQQSTTVCDTNVFIVLYFMTVIKTVSTCSDARLIGNDADRSSIHPSKADDDVLGVVRHNLIEITFIYNLQQQ